MAVRSLFRRQAVRSILGLKYGLQSIANVVGQNGSERSVLYIGEVRLIAGNQLLPLRSFDGVTTFTQGFDGLDTFVANLAHAQSQSVVA